MGPDYVVRTALQSLLVKQLHLQVIDPIIFSSPSQNTRDFEWTALGRLVTKWVTSALMIKAANSHVKKTTVFQSLKRMQKPCEEIKF